MYKILFTFYTENFHNRIVFGLKNGPENNLEVKIIFGLSQPIQNENPRFKHAAVCI